MFSKDFTSFTELFHKVATTDNAESGYCARGVANILRAAGVDVAGGNAHTWNGDLPQRGWVKLEGVSAADAPPTAVLVYDRGPEGQRNTPGQKYGHVEIVGVDENGKRTYTSDAVRNNAGGSDPGRDLTVYVHPDLIGQENVDNLLVGLEDGDEELSSSVDFENNELLNTLTAFAAIMQALFAPHPDTNVPTLHELLQDPNGENLGVNDPEPVHSFSL
ncbi:MAG: CHAP domain-containing protein [Pseudomonadota bacterium]